MSGGLRSRRAARLTNSPVGFYSKHILPVLTDLAMRYSLASSTEELVTFVNRRRRAAEGKIIAK